MRGEPARSPRLHVERGLHAGARLELPDASAHHAARVLRLGAGDALTLFDGSGGEYDARIVAIERTRVALADYAEQIRSLGAERVRMVATSASRDASNADAYLCGSPMMVNACIKLLTAKGLPNDRIFFDKFV